MLNKLLKYDLRANTKLFLIIWPAMLLFAGLQRLLLFLRGDSLFSGVMTAMLTVLMLFSMVAAVVLCFVICVVRFYSGLLRREGYLMFTLPVKPWQLLLSKFLTALLTLTVTCAFAYVGIAIILSGLYEEIWTKMFDLSTIFGGNVNVCVLILMALAALATLANLLLRVYFVSCLGHLFRRARVFLSILFFYLIGLLSQIGAMLMFSSVELIPTENAVVRALGRWLSSLSSNGALCLFFGGLLFVNAVIGCVYFFVSEVILRKRLNLD